VEINPSTFFNVMVVSVFHKNNGQSIMLLIQIVNTQDMMTMDGPMANLSISKINIIGNIMHIQIYLFQIILKI